MLIVECVKFCDEVLIWVEGCFVYVIIGGDFNSDS